MKENHTKTILEFYDTNAEFMRNDRYSDSSQTVYTKAGDKYHWLVSKPLKNDRLEIHQTDEHGRIIARDTYESQRNTIKCLGVERLQENGKRMVQFTSDEINMLYQFGENGKSGTLAMLNQILPSIKDPATNRIVSQTICKLSSLTPEVGSMLISSIKNRKLYEHDSSIRQRLAEAKKETKCTITTETKTREERRTVIMNLTKYEQETVINFNAGEQLATVYTRDRAVMRKLDALVTEFPNVYKLVGETDIDKTYCMAKSCINYRKPRKLDDKYRERKRVQMIQYNMQRQTIEKMCAQ